jgi:hypothetical protein
LVSWHSTIARRASIARRKLGSDDFTCAIPLAGTND